MSVERVETLIVGGGQAGLVMSHMLALRGCSHLVLERSRIAERWRTERWDNLRFQFPNWSVRFAEFLVSSRRSRRLRDQQRESGFHHRICRLHCSPGSMRCFGHRIAMPG
jgi:cation diffusion facilitator CzcD-associated flavoprotein CzcO